METKELKEILDLHALWLKGDPKGRQANLRGAYLYRANLYGANLEGANLYRANLEGAYLKGASLKGAYLKYANLKWANLYDANLYGAYLSGACLYSASLKDAYLMGADLKDAYLYGANLEGANLKGANLNGAKDVLRVGPTKDGYEFFGVMHSDGVRIKAGCRWFAVEEAKEHWNKTRGETALGRERLLFVNMIDEWSKQAQEL